ncbi:liver-expressed antimicrobial peptide 2-like [Clarias gariepinus]|uniref:liver-expressed antimicrobial peptide 2-like n=1 Tax=Clarias gariepinus TaxID=13013 RepID=UPI00234C762C|nr:liver-expressed antimicrobial peptide 2-like [Clarias gariepinus]
MQHYNQTLTILCLLALLVSMHQASSAPTLMFQATSGVKQSDITLYRKARVTPLWRILASKPHGAYCNDHTECSTGLCRNGFCSFDVPVES